MEKFSNEVATKVREWFEGDKVKQALDAIEKATPAETGTFEVVITTENLDRYQEVISMNGWELEHYRSNPVVLWGHDHFTLPIGKATDLRVEEGKLIAKGQFAPHAFAQEIRALYDAGIINATSVGFIEKEREGNLITKAELLEFSFVSVPANPYALSLAFEKNVSVNELVTKGFMHVQKDAEEEEKPEEEDNPETPENEPIEEEQPTDGPELTDEQKALADHIVKTLLATLKETGALEVVVNEPEGTEVEEEDVETEDEKIFAVKKTMQSLDTTLGDVLAELRQRHTPNA